MRTPKGTSYLSSAADFEQYRKRLRFAPCPHCGSVGFLICHGYLRGYGESGHEKVIRGRRFFCSNRGRRAGCGRTFSVLFSGFLRRHTVPAATLWKFFRGVRRGLSRKASWERLGSPFTVETGYRLWKSLRKRQVWIRSRLSRDRPPPATDSAEPIFQLLDHLAAIFPHSPCPIAAFQLRFQRPFLR